MRKANRTVAGFCLAARWLMEKDVAKQAGNDHPTSIPTGAFKTSDGYINIATTGGRIWQRFCEALGAPDRSTGPNTPRAPTARRTEKHLFGKPPHAFPDHALAIVILDRACGRR